MGFLLTRIISFSLLCLFPFSLLASDLSEQDMPPEEGNFVLPHSQALRPLIAFGQNILPEGVLVTYLYVDDFWKSRGYFVDLFPAFVYGISDDLAMMLQIPVSPGLKIDQETSAGLEDIPLLFEYAYYEGQNSSWVDKATIVAGGTFPTGSISEEPETGNGAPGIFLGGTYYRTYVNWYGFISPGMLLTTSSNKTKYGNTFFYQAGVGRNICDIGKEWIFSWITEMDGFYSEKNKINGVTNPNSGENVIYLTPSLRIRSSRFAFQVGMGVPIIQQLNGNQPREVYYLGGAVSWSFH
jgi:hypothetical protein